jgi:hypothetical protein
LHPVADRFHAARGRNRAARRIALLGAVDGARCNRGDVDLSGRRAGGARCPASAWQHQNLALAQPVIGPQPVVAGDGLWRLSRARRHIGDAVAAPRHDRLIGRERDHPARVGFWRALCRALRRPGGVQHAVAAPQIPVERVGASRQTDQRRSQKPKPHDSLRGKRHALPSIQPAL